MKKIIIGIVVLVAFGTALGAGYYFVTKGDDYGSPKPPKDLTGVIVPPVEFPMNGLTFLVPNASSTAVVLDLVSPTAKRDYPMGRFVGEDGTSQTLVAQDDFATPFENELRAVPIVVSSGELTQQYHLAILEGAENKHTTSLLIGEMIKIQSVTRAGNVVTVNYLVHDRGQELAELPKVQTAAIFDISTKQVVQVGRVPLSETYVTTKTFSGEYLWKMTKFSDGKTVTPSKPDVFTLTFDANRINLGTDCNSGGTTYVSETGSTTSFTVEPIASTKMFCEPGQEGEYFSMVQSVVDFSEGADGALVLMLPDDAKMTFVPKTATLEFAATSTDQ